MPLISIIIPVYNVDAYIEECITSVLNQSFTDFEIILIDDGSTDRSGYICDKYCIQDKRIKVIHQENKGVSVARNNGIKQSQGKYIMFVDADDCISNVSMELHIYYLNKDSVDLTMSGYSINANKVVSVMNNTNSAKIYSGTYMFEKMLSGDCSDGYLWNKMFKADIIKQNSLFFKEGIKVWEDMLFLMEYYTFAKSISVFPEVLYYYRQRSNSAVNTINISKEIDKMVVLKTIFFFPCKKSDTFYKYIGNILVSLFAKIYIRNQYLSNEEMKRIEDIREFVLTNVDCRKLNLRNRVSFFLIKIKAI